MFFQTIRPPSHVSGHSCGWCLFFSFWKVKKFLIFSNVCRCADKWLHSLYGDLFRLDGATESKSQHRSAIQATFIWRNQLTDSIAQPPVRGTQESLKGFSRKTGKPSGLHDHVNNLLHGNWYGLAFLQADWLVAGPYNTRRTTFFNFCRKSSIFQVSIVLASEIIKIQ